MSTFSKYKIRDFEPNCPMGRALIINVLNMETSNGSRVVRDGSQEDVKRLNFLLQYLNFSVKVIDDPTGHEIRSEIINFVDSINKENLGKIFKRKRPNVYRCDRVGIKVFYYM